MHFLIEDIEREYYNGDSACTEGTPNSVPKVNTPSANSKVISEAEIKSPNQIKNSEATKRWDDYLGPNQTNIEETWTYDPSTDTFTVTNYSQRLKK